MDGLFLPLILALAVAFLFISFRNQKKRTAAMAELKAQAVPGARIQLTSGLFGTLHSDDGGDTVDVEIAPGVITTWNRLAIREVVPEATAGDQDQDALHDDHLDADPLHGDNTDTSPSGDAPESTDDHDSKDK